MDTKKIPPFWTGCPCRLRENWAGSSGAGFDMMGTVPSTKNAWAPKTPVFFSWWALYPVLNTAGHLDLLTWWARYLVQKMHGHPKPQVFFPWWALYPVLNTTGHLDPAPPSKFSPSPWDEEMTVSQFDVLMAYLVILFYCRQNIKFGLPNLAWKQRYICRKLKFNSWWFLFYFGGRGVLASYNLKLIKKEWDGREWNK